MNECLELILALDNFGHSFHPFFRNRVSRAVLFRREIQVFVIVQSNSCDVNRFLTAVHANHRSEESFEVLAGHDDIMKLPIAVDLEL